MPDWKREYIANLKESIAFFGNESKFQREKHVVVAVLDCLGLPFSDSELHEAEEPVDVRFRDANFQIKEVMQPERRRGDELKEALKKVKAAKMSSDLLHEYTPQDVTLDTIVEKCVARSDELLTKYGPQGRSKMDLVCYFNFLDYSEIEQNYRAPENFEFRSFTVVSNRFVVVLYAQDEAPDFLKVAVGTVMHRHTT